MVDKVLPYGFWLSEAPRSESISSLKDWTWVPKGQIKRIQEEASFPGTTGTGPDARQDERPDEM